MRFVNKRRKGSVFVLLMVTLVMLAWVAVPLAQSATITVTSTADSGPGSLRQALLDAVSGDTITFDTSVFPPGSPATIVLTSELPPITQDNLTIDGSNAGVILDGSNVSHGGGLTVRSDNNVVRGLQIYYFPEVGIEVSSGADHNTIGGDRTSGSGPTGEGNVLSGNGVDGIAIDSDYNIVRGNFVGTDSSGQSDLGNNTEGVRIRGGAYNVIGGETEGQRNIISGNGNNGVWIHRESHDNTVSGNFIGTDLDGRQAIPNDGNGVAIGEDSYDNLIGGDTEDERNLISGNDNDGVAIWGTATMTNTMENTVSGNYIGTDVNGTDAIPNDGNGVSISDGARHNVIGGNAPGERNIISGNGGQGVGLWDTGTSSNTIEGNYIGTDFSGAAALGNQEDGVHMNGASHNQVIDNLISGNGGSGVGLCCTSDTNSNTVQGNYIGTNASGTAALPNNYHGVWIGSGASHNQVINNLISGNEEDGVSLHSSDTSHNTISGNYIGTDASGTAVLSNLGNGIEIGSGASQNVIGGDNPGERNVISGNEGFGVGLWDTGTSFNTITGNYIGTDFSGAAALGNQEDGVHMNGASHNQVIDNLISGNQERGVNFCCTSETSYNTIQGNYIGTDASGAAALGNGSHGVAIYGGAYNLIGGDTLDERNVISGNGNDGVSISGSDAMSNTVSGNYIGTDATGTAALGNGGNGVGISGSSMHNTIGGRAGGEGNVIAANAKDGILIWDASNNLVIGNLIGTDASGTVDLGNNWSGLTAASGASYNRIEYNVISGNGDGVEFVHADTVSNTVVGNYIGLDATGTLPLGNDSQGVYICSDSSHNRIGGSDPGEGNVIAYNRGPGVRVNGDNTIENTLTHNSIHSNLGLGIVNLNGGNRELAPPAITRLTAGDTISGTACANCTVEVFSDDVDEGRIYEGTTTADGAGRFSLTKPGGFTGPNVTATATDADGDTSEFSEMVAQRLAENVKLVSQIGGTVETVAISGTLAYIGAGPRLVILDVSDPANAALVGRTDVLPGRVMEIVLAQDYAYVAGGYQGLRIIDVSDPTSPSEVGFYDTPGHAWGIAVAAGDPQGHTYAYVADGDSPQTDRTALRIIDVSDPANPSEVGSYEELDDARDVTVVGSKAYVAGGCLHIIDVSDPTSPSEIGSYCTPRDDPWGPPPSMFGRIVVAADDPQGHTYAYLAEWPMGDPSRSGLLIVDVSDPTEPTEAGFYYRWQFGDIVVRDSLAYVAGEGLDVIDVSDPTEPTSFGNYSLAGTYSLAVAGDYAYVGLADGGLAIVDISNPASPTGAGSYHDTPGISLDVAVAGNYAYVAGKPMFGIVDISDPAVPTYTGFYDTAGYGYGVVVTGDYAYVTVGYYGLSVMDVSDPTAPSEVGFCDTPGSAYGVAIADSYAYVADGYSGLRVINIADPANPSEVGFYDTPGSARGVAVAAGDAQGHTYAYVADEDSGLRVIDVSDPANPSEVGFYVYDTGSAYDVAVAGNYVYVADVPVWVWEKGGWIGGGLRIINIANPASPSEVGFYDTLGDAYSVTVADGYAYVAAGDTGLRIVDISDQAHPPTQAGFYDTPGRAYSVTVTDSYAYVAEGNGGLAILRFRFHIYLPLVLKGY